MNKKHVITKVWWKNGFGVFEQDFDCDGFPKDKISRVVRLSDNEAIVVLKDGREAKIDMSKENYESQMGETFN